MEGTHYGGGSGERYDGYDGKLASLLDYLMYLCGGDDLLYTKKSFYI